MRGGGGGSVGGGGEKRGLKPVLIAQNRTFNSDAASNDRFDPHRGRLPYL